jgi:predicted phosphodiesterase
LHALEDALRQIDQLGCDSIVCAGDLLDFGLFPDKLIALLASRKIATVRGNHDRWAIDRRPGQHGGGWELSQASRTFLTGLPLSLEFDLDGVRVAVHHASPKGDMDAIDGDQISYDRAAAHLRRAHADVLMVGHTHVAFALEVAGVGVIVNPAALLRDPAEGHDNPPATGTFGVLELPSRVFTVHRAADGTEVEIIRRRVAL